MDSTSTEDALASAEAKLAKTEDALANAEARLENATETIEVAHRIIREVTEKQAAGKIVEFEYGHLPKRREFSQLPHMKNIAEVFRKQELVFQETLESFGPFLIKATEIESNAIISTDPSWRNPWFPFIDAITTYGLIAKHQPKRYVEVGSGFSTKFARRAIRDFSPQTKIISIDPDPRDEINAICDEIVRAPLESVDAAFLNSLTKDDIFFLDSSHRVDQGSDVAVFFSEILPNFPEGMIYGIHDIFYPDADYPATWLDRHYSEQYMLMSYLFGGAGGDEILLPCYYISRRAHLYSAFNKLLEHENVIPATSDILGQSFWMRKGKQP